MQTPLLKSVVSTLALGLVILTANQSAVFAAPVQYYPVTKVVDGDTIVVTINKKAETVRLIGVDTPETVDPRKPVQCFGKEAANKTKELLAGKNVRLEKDPTQGERDKYGRLLAYVYRQDGLFLNKYLVAEGYAHEYTYNIPYKRQAEFKAAQKDAQTKLKGLWNPKTCAQPKPHVYYLSSASNAKYYYCDTDLAWKGLSPKYLKSYTSEVALKKAYPKRVLHEPCK